MPSRGFFIEAFHKSNYFLVVHQVGGGENSSNPLKNLFKVV
jgi:hypothetical protein